MTFQLMICPADAPNGPTGTLVRVEWSNCWRTFIVRYRSFGIRAQWFNFNGVDRWVRQGSFFERWPAKAPA